MKESTYSDPLDQKKNKKGGGGGKKRPRPHTSPKVKRVLQKAEFEKTIRND